MKDKMKQFLKLHPSLLYLQKCISGFRNHDFVQLMTGEGSGVLRIEELGKLHAEHVIYQIVIRNSADGFFALLRATLNYLYFADLMHMSPVVIWGKEVPYAEGKPVDGSNNPFTYYFSQTSNISETEVENSRYVVRSIWGHQSFADGLKESQQGYDHSEEYLKKMALLFRKYVTLNEKVLKMLEQDMGSLMISEKAIGVHVRGTDYRNSYKNHPIMAAEEEYFEVLDQYLKDEHYNQIFLATDDSSILNSFVNKYGEKILFFPETARGNGAVSVAFSESQREQHHFRLGYEVLRDAYIMSCCAGFIGNLSQVSIGTQILKYSRDEMFDFKIIVDNGIHKDGKPFEKPE